MPGRRPKPTALKLVTGNPGKRALPEEGAEPVPPAGEIIRPAFLKKRAAELWYEYAPVCTSMGTLTTADPHLLAEWCQLTVKMERNRTTASERAQRRMIGTELGIGAASRAKIGAGGKRPPADPADAFFQGTG